MSFQSNFDKIKNEMDRYEKLENQQKIVKSESIIKKINNSLEQLEDFKDIIEANYSVSDEDVGITDKEFIELCKHIDNTMNEINQNENLDLETMLEKYIELRESIGKIRIYLDHKKMVIKYENK